MRASLLNPGSFFLLAVGVPTGVESDSEEEDCRRESLSEDSEARFGSWVQLEEKNNGEHD